MSGTSIIAQIFIPLRVFFFFFFFFFLHYNRKFHFDLYDLHLKRERKKEDI